MLQDVISSCGKRKNTVLYDVFASLAQKRKSKSGHFGAQVWPAQRSLTQLGAMLAHLAACLVTCGAMLTNLGAMLAYLAAMLARLGAMLAHLGAMLAHLGAHVGPSWSYVGPTWSAVGPTRPLFGAFVGPAGRIWAQLEPQQHTSWRATKHRKIQCLVGSGATTEPKPAAMLTLFSSCVHPSALPSREVAPRWP